MHVVRLSAHLHKHAALTPTYVDELRRFIAQVLLKGAQHRPRCIYEHELLPYVKATGYGLVL